jgi:hypothetical protein
MSGHGTMSTAIGGAVTDGEGDGDGGDAHPEVTAAIADTPTRTSRARIVMQCDAGDASM